MNHQQSGTWVPECLHPDTAASVAEHMLGRVEDVDPFFRSFLFFRQNAIPILRAGLLATALSGRTTGDLVALLSSGDVQTLLETLREHPDHVPPAWIRELQQLLLLDNPTRDGTLETARNALETNSGRQTQE